jgi:hypothetical protein
MTEAEWLACDDLQRMIGFLQLNMRRGRKLQLFAAAGCRRIWRLVVDERNRQAVALAERVADREASEAERAVAADTSYSLYAKTSAPGGPACARLLALSCAG